jgi:hypothetical protein
VTESFDWFLIPNCLASIILSLFVALICFSVVLTSLAINDTALLRQVVDGRYFTRIFIYKSVSFLCVVSFVAAFYIQDLRDLRDIYAPGALLSGFIFLLPFSLHTISGVATCREKDELSAKKHVIHIIMQLLLFLDILSSLILILDEKKRHPEERTDLYKHAFAPRPMPVPGLYGVLLAICAVLFLNSGMGLAYYRISNFLLYLWGDFKRGWYLQLYVLSILFSFLISVVIRAICDAAYYLRKQPADVMSRPFLNKILLFSAAALVLEVALFLIMNLTVGSLVNFAQSGDFSYRSRPIVHHVLFIALLVTSFILVQVSVFLYTRFSVKRSLTDRVISDKTASLFTWLSLVPVWQLVVVYFLFKANRESRGTG